MVHKSVYNIKLCTLNTLIQGTKFKTCKAYYKLKNMLMFFYAQRKINDTDLNVKKRQEFRNDYMQLKGCQANSACISAYVCLTMYSGMYPTLKLVEFYLFASRRLQQFGVVPHSDQLAPVIYSILTINYFTNIRDFLILALIITFFVVFLIRQRYRLQNLRPGKVEQRWFEPYHPFLATLQTIQSYC